MIARVDENGKTQQIEEHLRNVSENCSLFLAGSGFPEIGRLLGLLHDIGKYSTPFQNYIKSRCGLLKEGDPGYTSEQRGSVPHAEVGLWYLKHPDSFCSRDLTVLLGMPVMYHHGFLEDVYSPDGSASFIQKKPSGKLELEKIYADIDPPVKESVQKILQQKAHLAEITSFIRKQQTDSFDLGVLLRLLYSSLIDADRLDAAGRSSTIFSGWKILIDRMEKNLSALTADTPINQLRRQISGQVRNSSEYPAGIYNLTIPTGGGKTLAGLRFALHHAEKHHFARIFYAAPFLSILEQNAEEIRSILDDPRGEYVLECHSNILPEQKDDGDDSAISENWDAPIICTSMVQILNAMFSGESRYARRFHQFAGSVMILDEMQSLPVELLHLFSRMINFISERMNATIVLCSATQPQLDKLDPMRGTVRFSVPKELYPEYPELFRALKRVQTEYIPDIRTDQDIAAFVQKSLETAKSLLLICNTKRHAAEMYRLLKEEYPNDLVYHLSTRLCPQHRKEILLEIKRQLKTDQRVIVCSTSLIEAGVNISFETVIRMMSSLDSIVQAAGRCNRNAEAVTGHVYILDNPQGLHLTASVSCWSESTRAALWQYEQNPDLYDHDILSPHLLECYYRNLYEHLKPDPGNPNKPDLMAFPVSVDGIKEKRTLLELLGNNQSSFLAYRRKEELPASEKPLCVRGAFRTAGEKFRALDDIASSSVIVPYGRGKEIIAELCTMPKSERFKALLKEAQLYAVNITEQEEKKLRASRSVHEICRPYAILIADESCYDPAALGLGEGLGHLSLNIL